MIWIIWIYKPIINNDWLPGIWIDNEIILDFKVVSRFEKEIPDWFRKANPNEEY